MHRAARQRIRSMKQPRLPRKATANASGSTSQQKGCRLITIRQRAARGKNWFVSRPEGSRAMAAIRLSCFTRSLDGCGLLFEKQSTSSLQAVCPCLVKLTFKTLSEGFGISMYRRHFLSRHCGSRRIKHAFVQVYGWWQSSCGEDMSRCHEQVLILLRPSPESFFPSVATDICVHVLSLSGCSIQDRSRAVTNQWHLNNITSRDLHGGAPGCRDMHVPCPDLL